MKPSAEAELLHDVWSLRGMWELFSANEWVRKQCLPWLISLDQLFYPKLLGKTMTPTEIGRSGELLGARWLRCQRRKILYRNYRGPNRGEVDIVARQGDVLTFIEVKTRTGTAFGRPADAVNLDKQRLIQRGAQNWLRLLGKPNIAFRFDILEVLLVPGEMPRLHLVENAFSLPDSSLSGR